MPAAIGGQKHDLRPPDMSLRAVAILHDGGQGLTVRFGEVDGSDLAHPPDSHGQVAEGILNQRWSEKIGQSGKWILRLTAA